MEGELVNHMEEKSIGKGGERLDQIDSSDSVSKCSGDAVKDAKIELTNEQKKSDGADKVKQENPEKSKIVPEDEKTKIVPEDEKTKIVPEDEKTKIVRTEDVKTKIVPADEKTKIVPEDVKTKIIPEDKKTKIVPEDEKTKIVPADEKTKIVPEDVKTKIVPEDEKTKIVPEDVKTKIVPEDTDLKDLADGDQFTEPEILDPAILDQCQTKMDEDSSEGDGHKPEWVSRQKVERVLDSSSDGEISGGSERKVKRRKKRPKTTDQAAIDRQKKMQEIQEVLSSSPLDIERLRDLAVGDGGLVKDELRRKAWPRLMMIEHMEVTPKPTLDVVKAHKDYYQVVLDVNRSLKRFPPGIDDDYRLILMDQLTTLIVRVLMKHPDLHYYQGFHDVAITFLLVMGEDVGFEMVEKLAVTHLCDFMRPTMEKTTYYLTYLYPILKRSDPKLHQFLIDSGVGTVFCLPWLITWFAHTLSDYRNVVRLYDFFLATPYLMPMYIATAIVLKKKQDILSGECDMAMQHFILSQVPDTLPFEEILIKANVLHDLYPPNTLQEEVDEFIKKKNEEEALERQQVIDRRKKFEAARRGRHYRDIMYAVSRYNPIPPAQTKMIVKVAFFAITAYFATSLYSYYSESPSLFPFYPRQ